MVSAAIRFYPCIPLYDQYRMAKKRYPDRKYDLKQLHKVSEIYVCVLHNEPGDIKNFLLK